MGLPDAEQVAADDPAAAITLPRNPPSGRVLKVDVGVHNPDGANSVYLGNEDNDDVTPLVVGPGQTIIFEDIILEHADTPEGLTLFAPVGGAIDCPTMVFDRGLIGS